MTYMLQVTIRAFIDHPNFSWIQGFHQGEPIVNSSYPPNQNFQKPSIGSYANANVGLQSFQSYTNPIPAK